MSKKPKTSAAASKPKPRGRPAKTVAVESVDNTYLEGLIGYNCRRAALAVISVFLERMAVYGSVAPDLWMKNATRSPVGAEALLAAAADALKKVK